MSGAGREGPPEVPDRAVIEAARTHARDRYLAALLAPAAARADLLVLAAYAGEIGRIPLVAHEPQIGEIRLQWWRDALAAPDGTSGHPVADALRALARRRGLRQDLVLAPLEGFARELYEDGIAEARALALYADESQGAVMRLALAVLGGAEASAAARLVAPAARALALTRLALTLPQHLAHGRLPLPDALVGRAGDPRTLAPSEARQAARTLAEALAREARTALAEVRAEERRVEGALMAAFLPLSLVEAYLESALAPGRDALLEIADISPLSRVARLWFAHWRGRV